MARTVVQLPADGTGKKLDAVSFASPNGTDGTVYANTLLVCDASGNIVDAIAAAPAGTERGLVTRNIPSGTQNVAGALVPAGNGSIVAATTVVGPFDVTLAGNITVTVNGTYAGVNFVFEASDDGGTTWYGVQAMRQDAGLVESSSGVLPANQARMWDIPCEAFNRIRVRATAWTSGTAAIRVTYGTMPFTGVVGAITQPPARTLTMFQATAVTPGGTAIALMSLTPYRALAAGGAATSHAVTAGKTLRISSINVTLYNSSAAVNAALLELRFNAAGAAVTTSPIAWSTSLATATATANAGAALNMSFPDGSLEFPSGSQIGLTMTPTATTARFNVAIFGYEL